MWRRSAAISVALFAVLAGCVERGSLFAPEDPAVLAAAPRPVLSPEYALYEGDVVPVRVAPSAASGSLLELIAVRADLSVAWRSTATAISRDTALVNVAAVPMTLFGADSLRLTASVIEPSGRRIYAARDTTRGASLAAADFSPVRFFRGQVQAAETGVPQSFALDAVRGVLYFANQNRAEVGIYDIAANRFGSARLGVTTGPVSLSYRGGYLGALVGDGTELLMLDPSDGFGVRARRLLPTIVVEAETPTGQLDSLNRVITDTVRVAARPYARDLELSCGDVGCAEPLAFARSEVVGGGAFGGDQLRGVVRVIRPFGDAGAAPVVAPGFFFGLPGDTVASQIRAFTGSSRNGSDSLVYERLDGFRCPTLSLGAGLIAASPIPGGPVFAADDDAKPLCGEGTRIVRIDRPSDLRPSLSLVAVRNQLGEDRIGVIRQIEVSPDGQRVLVLADRAVHVLDLDLRLRGTIPLPSPGAAAWVRGVNTTSMHFGVTVGGSVVVFEAERFTEVARLAVGATRPGLLALYRTPTEVVAVAAPTQRPGFVSARTASF